MEVEEGGGGVADSSGLGGATGDGEDAGSFSERSKRSCRRSSGFSFPGSASTLLRKLAVKVRCG